MSKKIADLLFPNIVKTSGDLEQEYPQRELKEGAKVTRLGPSPTGFIHLGNLYGAFVDERLAHQSEGLFYLRIEDTDDKRYVEGAVETIIDSLNFFGIKFDEGAVKEGEMGNYGPYSQSQRADIYQVYVKELLEKGMAYPCFMTEEEIADVRAKQEANKETPGIYGQYALCRDLSDEEVEAKIAEGIPFVVRLKSDGKQGEEAKIISVQDGIRGELTMPENFQDVVILKATGIPTYHFAHVVDDHLMRTTHVVRGEEWLSSLPIHVELFEKLGFELPVYCHTAQLMKIGEDGNKRKLSKRKDPELALDYYKEMGYHPQAVREYLLTILNSNYEEWRIENPDLPCEDFEFTMEKMSNSGALFDLNKLNDVSKDTLVKIPAADLYTFLVEWAREFKPEVLELIEGREDYLLPILDLGREGNKPRKDFVCASQMFEFISYFFDEYFKIEDEVPAEAAELTKEILEGYLETYDHSDDQSQWFDKIRELGTKLGYAAKPKDFKKNPDDYRGHVGHVSTAIRIAVMGRSQSPDVWEIQQILGEEKTRARIEAFLNR
ncbi:MAG: glutamate--tRNA ligase [Eubacterium sp.]|nr:glutamate--tRNA ligase [Eubacterium sp.]